MEKKGYIEIRIVGKKGNLDLSPENFDINEISSVLEQVENLLFPNDNPNDKTLVNYHTDNDEIYLKKLRQKASWIKNIEPVSWLNEIRGNDA
jgi:hypothetical protein